MTGKDLTLVKHSLSDIIESVLARAWELSGEGRQRAPIFAEQLSEYSLEDNASSIKPRTIEIAETIAKGYDRTSCMFEGLHEHAGRIVLLLTQVQFRSPVKDSLNRSPNLFLDMKLWIPNMIVSGRLSSPALFLPHIYRA